MKQHACITVLPRREGVCPGLCPHRVGGFAPRVGGSFAPRVGGGSPRVGGATFGNMYLREKTGKWRGTPKTVWVAMGRFATQREGLCPPRGGVG